MLICTLVLSLIAAQTPTTLTPEQFGATGTNATEDVKAMVALVQKINDLGGNVKVVGKSGATYRISGEMEVTVSNVTMDWNGARFVGQSGHFVFRGTGPSNRLKNIHFLNAKFGTTDWNDCPRGPKPIFCDDSSIENIEKTGYNGTSFLPQFCRRLKLTNIVNRGAQTLHGAYGILLVHCEDSVVDRCLVADGPFRNAYEIKGGSNNTVMNSRTENVTAGGTLHLGQVRGDFQKGDVVTGGDSGATGRVIVWDAIERTLKLDQQSRNFKMNEPISSRNASAKINGKPEYVQPRAAFAARGDAPFKGSRSAYLPIAYPFADGGYDVPDIRRASRNTKFSNCSSSTSDDWTAGFVSQEAVGTTYDRCTPNGAKKEYQDVKVRGSRYMRVAADLGQIHSGSVIQGSQSGARALVVGVFPASDGTWTIYLAQGAAVAYTQPQGFMRLGAKMTGSRSGATAKLSSIQGTDAEDFGAEDDGAADNTDLQADSAAAGIQKKRQFKQRKSRGREHSGGALLLDDANGSFSKGESVSIGRQASVIAGSETIIPRGEFKTGESLMIDGQASGKVLQGPVDVNPH